jgi:hypothetical protein
MLRTTGRKRTLAFSRISVALSSPGTLLTNLQHTHTHTHRTHPHTHTHTSHTHTSHTRITQPHTAKRTRTRLHTRSEAGARLLVCDVVVAAHVSRAGDVTAVQPSEALIADARVVLADTCAAHSGVRWRTRARVVLADTCAAHSDNPLQHPSLQTRALCSQTPVRQAVATFEGIVKRGACGKGRRIIISVRSRPRVLR